MRRSARLGRSSVLAALAGALLLAGVGRPGAGGKAQVVSTAQTTTPSTTTPPSASPTVNPVTLTGEGSWDPYRELTNWQNDLYGTDGLVNLQYTPTGGFQGREDFVAGNLDFAISGNPFTAAELSALPGGVDDLIKAPVFVGALAFAVVPPYVAGAPVTLPNSHGWVVFRQPCDDGGDGTPPTHPDDPTSCDMYSAYTGQVNIPSVNLASMFLGNPGSDFTMNSWNDPAVLQAWGFTQGSDYAPPQLVQTSSSGLTPFPVTRSDPSETTYYLQEFIKRVAPDLWANLAQKATKQGVSLEPITDRVPELFFGLTVQTSRDGVDQQALWAVEPSGSNLSNSAQSQGVIAPVPPSALGEMQGIKVSNNAVDTGAAASATFAGVQNGAGQYEIPTPATINAAVNASGETPLGALTDATPGAYPLVYVDDLYAPSHGLSIDKTESLATLIRYLATRGQTYGEAQGDGQLSPALVNQALAAANQVVLSNCTGSGTQVVSDTSPGRYAPTGTLTTIGPMLHCQAAPPPVPSTTSTTTPATTVASRTGQSGSSSSGSLGGVSTAPPPQVVLGGTASGPSVSVPSVANAAPSGGSGTNGGPNLAISLTKLPMPIPTGISSAFDQLATMIAGALLLVLLLRAVKAIARALSP